MEELNIKPKNWKELLTDEPFTRADIITIQDPRNLQKFNMTGFHHLKLNLKIPNEGKVFCSMPCVVIWSWRKRVQSLWLL